MVAIARGCVIELDRNAAIALCAACRIVCRDTAPPPEIEEELAPLVCALEEFFGFGIDMHGGATFYEDDDGADGDDD
jgi:hypothetical protein